jgi:AcrR family transcriptional regulator
LTSPLGTDKNHVKFYGWGLDKRGKRGIIKNKRSFYYKSTAIRGVGSMPKVTEEHRQARREQILEAALNCFARSGFHQTSMRDICKEAGLSAGAVYLHFSSKEDIIEASWQRVREARMARLESAKRKGSAIQALDELLDDYERRLAQADTDRVWQLGVQLYAEALRNPRIRESIRRNWDDGVKQIAELISQDTEWGEINYNVDCDALARVWLAIHDGLILMKIIEPEKDVQEYFKAWRTLMYNCGNMPYSKARERRADDE